ncbi:reprolysin-like metallopeptidase [Polaribacter marinivivus]|uniref:Reprolysin-like metallopeptidase n=1 Tax=Polaribacter marinivivus TaxID=1524260 RepID=A0ABV8R4V4_9FLAO
MNVRNPLFITFLILTMCVNTYSQNTWEQITKLDYKKNTNEIYSKKNFPKEYKLISLDVEAFTNGLNLKSKNAIKTIALPDANGDLKRFTIKETSTFEKGLQEKYPNIRSYTAKGIDDPTAIAKISIGTDGFHGTIYSGNHATVYIDPHSKDKKDYIVYSRLNLPKNEIDFKCMVEETVNEKVENTTFNRIVNDGKLRTYRIAIVTSGEYSQFHINRQNVPSTATDAVKKAAVLSAMNTSMTRINGVFEKDLGVNMVIVSNNDSIIFLDANTDNISDGSAGTMINETQTICDAQIGNANYDIGHIFSIGGAGLAGLGVVCVSGQKARGVTGISSPINDPYDIDYVAHELGHQFGATHTQNNSCNRTNSTAVEPGSGSTIMGYAGICSPNVFGAGNATGNSDDHFHTVSIAQMQNIIQTSGNCATLSDTNNATPTADAGNDYIIPKSTPFRLTGEATDADGINSLTYNWEQIDNEVGATMPPESTNAVGPMFRSLPSKTIPVRYFPDLSVIVAGKDGTWEVLPSVARDLNFAFTVRDNNSGGGSTARDDVKVTVADVPAFAVTSQQSSETWDVGSSQEITWSHTTTNTAPINCTLVNIKMSTDGGITFPIVLKANTPNDGSETIIVPNNASNNVRIMVEAVGNIFYNVNNSSITINSAPTFIVTNTSDVQSACNVAGQSASYSLNFDFVNGFSETVTLSAANEPFGAQVTFSPTTINADGNVMMTVSNLDGAIPIDYTINVTGTSNSITQTIGVALKVTTSSLNTVNLTSPADSDTGVATSAILTWEEETNAASYEVQVATDNGFNNIVSSGTVTTTNFTTSTLNESTTYFWRVKPKNTCTEGNFSSIYSFTTEGCTVCTSNGSLDFATSTTLVQFNTINNASGKTVPYTDYTSLSTSVKRGDSHDLSVSVNSDGNFRVQTKAWIDWNGDCVFDTSTEEYDLGGASNTPNGVTDMSPLSITIPATAKLGPIIMRISTKYTDPSPSPVDYPTACETGFDGEVEDYALIIEDATASLEDVSFNKFNLFPNPNTGNFTLMFETLDTSKTTLQLYDVRGRQLAEKIFRDTKAIFREEIQFNNLAKGLYLLKITNGNKQSARKLIIE